MITIDLQPVDESLDGRQLDELIELWLQHFEMRLDVDKNTVIGYAGKVAFFREWWTEEGPRCSWALNKRKMHQFGEWLSTARSQYNQPLEYNTRRDVMRRLKTCLRWAFVNGYLSRDITPWLPAVAGSARLRKRASLDDLYALVEAAGMSGEPVRDQAFVALLMGTGLRKMEAANVNIEHIDFDDDLSGTIKVAQAKKVGGRKVQGRLVAFDPWTGHFLAALIAVYHSRSGPLFRVPGSDRRIGDMAAYRIVKRAIGRASLQDKIEGPHDLRRNFATWFSKQHRGELYGRLLSKQLGHSGFTQTDEYILHDADDLAEVITSPLAGRPFPKIKRHPAAGRRRPTADVFPGKQERG